MFETLKSVILGREHRRVVYECRRCGTTLEADAETCHRCGNAEITRFVL